MRCIWHKGLILLFCLSLCTTPGRLGAEPGPPELPKELGRNPKDEVKKAPQPQNPRGNGERFVFGRVVDESGLPVAGADLCLTAVLRNPSEWSMDLPQPSLLTSCRSDRAGNYSMELDIQELDSRAQLYLYAIGEGTCLVRVSFPARNIRQPGPLRVVLARAPGIRLHLLDEQRQPLPNAQVTIRHVRPGAPKGGTAPPGRRTGLSHSTSSVIPEPWQSRFTGTTDGEGRIEFSHVFPEMIDTIEIRDERVPLTISFAASAIDAGMRPDSSDCELQFPPLGEVHGRLTGNDLQLPADLRVWLGTGFQWIDPAGFSSRIEVPLDADGTFHARLPHGMLMIDPLLPKDQPWRSLPPRMLAVVPGQSMTVDVPVYRCASVTGVAVRQDTGEPLPGVPLQFTSGLPPESSSVPLHSFLTTTDETGRFAIFLPPGPATCTPQISLNELICTDPWKNSGSPKFSTYDIPEGGETFDIGKIEFSPQSEGTGTLVDSRQRVVAGAQVSGFPDVPGLDRSVPRKSASHARTDREGRFRYRYPNSHPPAFWQVRFMVSDSGPILERPARVLTEEPLVLQLEEDEAPPRD